MKLTDKEKQMAHAAKATQDELAVVHSRRKQAVRRDVTHTDLPHKIRPMKAEGKRMVRRARAQILATAAFGVVLVGALYLSILVLFSL